MSTTATGMEEVEFVVCSRRSLTFLEYLAKRRTGSISASVPRRWGKSKFWKWSFALGNLKSELLVILSAALIVLLTSDVFKCAIWCPISTKVCRIQSTSELLRLQFELQSKSPVIFNISFLSSAIAQKFVGSLASALNASLLSNVVLELLFGRYKIVILPFSTFKEMFFSPSATSDNAKCRAVFNNRSQLCG